MFVVRCCFLWWWSYAVVVVIAADIHALFASVDVDNGNAVNFNEFLAATLERRELDERRLKLAFDRLDYDHSGTIDCKYEDMVQVVPKASGHCPQHSFFSVSLRHDRPHFCFAQISRRELRRTQGVA